jgi:hypothetical protein
MKNVAGPDILYPPCLVPSHSWPDQVLTSGMLQFHRYVFGLHHNCGLPHFIVLMVHVQYDFLANIATLLWISLATSLWQVTLCLGIVVAN